jgi:hypothetical protein
MMEAQRSEAWRQSRAGRITASRMCDVMAFSEVGDGVYKSGPRKGQPRVAEPLKARTDYIRQLAAERITGNAKAEVRANALEWGKEWEPVAWQCYEERTGLLVTPASFVIHPQFDFIGASADAFIGSDGGGESKCPYDQEVHLATIITGLPEEHIEQIQGCMWVTGRQWWDFISFHPYYPEPLRLYVQRVKRDDAYIANLEAACLSLNTEVESIVSELRARISQEKAA